MKPLVSVIIPTYNRLGPLQEAIHSVLSQDYPDWELIVVDDGSTDGTAEFLQALPQKHLAHSIKIFQQINQGPGPARNLGVQHAKGELITFLDSDDHWLPKKLLAQVEFMKQHPDYQLCQSEEIWIRNGRRVNPKHKHQKPSGWIFEKCLELCLISPSAVMLRKNFFNELGGFDKDFFVCEDYELWLRATLCSPVQTLAEPLVVKRGGHGDQLSRRHWGMDRFRVQALEKTLNTQDLTLAQQSALLAALQTKLKILASGFLKHNPDQENPYERQIQWLQNEYKKIIVQNDWTDAKPTISVP